MSTDIISIVNSIPDRQAASLTVTDTNGSRLQIPCTYKEAEAPAFFLLFTPGALPQNITKEWRCALVCKDAGEEPVTFSAQIVELPNNRVIEMVAKKSIRPEDLREYFRVNLKMPVTVFYANEQEVNDESPMELTGETVDISQTGVLTILSDECTPTNPLTLEIDLPNPAASIICTACVVRSKRIRRNHYLTSFHFDDISARSRDLIAKNCFAEQRRQLRENIQTIK